MYSKALEHNVCLMAWEHIALLLEHKVKETENYSLESLWNSSQMIARDSSLAFANRQEIKELIAAKKLNEKISVISAYIDKLKN